MQTLLFMEHNLNTYGVCGFQLSRQNVGYAPIGRLHIARFDTAFIPSRGLGYYGDIYMRSFIRKWKSKVISNKRQFERKMAILCLSTKRVLNEDTLRCIIDYL